MCPCKTEAGARAHTHVHIYTLLHVGECACMCILCMKARGHSHMVSSGHFPVIKELRDRFFPRHTPSSFGRQGLSLILKPTHLARLSGHQVIRILLSLVLQHRDPQEHTTTSHISMGCWVTQAGAKPTSPLPPSHLARPQKQRGLIYKRRIQGNSIGVCW